MQTLVPHNIKAINRETIHLFVESGYMERDTWGLNLNGSDSLYLDPTFPGQGGESDGYFHWIIKAHGCMQFEEITLRGDSFNSLPVEINVDVLIGFDTYTLMYGQ